MGVEVGRGGGVRHARGDGGRLGQDAGAVDGLGKGGVGRGSGGCWHIEFWVGASIAHRNQLLFSARVLTLSLKGLTAHDQLTFGRYPCGDGNCLRSGQPQRLQIQTIYRDECYIAGQPHGYRAGVRRAASQREALDRRYLPRLRQEVCARCRGTADPDAALATILDELNVA